jgi:hypothetical protein
MIHLNLTYGINIYGCANTKNLEKLRKTKASYSKCMQRKFRAHTGPLFKEQKILLIDKIIEHSRFKFMHSF